jgi:N-acetylmuramate 1-kinase
MPGAPVIRMHSGQLNMQEELRERLEVFLASRNQPIEISPITPDASTREYFHVKWNEIPAIACVYPFNELCFGQFEACLDVTDVFLSANLPVARIYASDEEKQIIIQEDFGDTLLRDRLRESDAAQNANLIDEAIKLIVRIQAATPLAYEKNSIASRLKFDEEKLLWELNFFQTHYFETFKQKKLSETDDAALTAEFIELSRELERRAAVLCHRDFHAANLMLDKENRLRIIDHQDARIGSVAYDLVSLLLDRILQPPAEDWLNKKKQFFLAERERLGLEKIDFEDFDYEFDLMTVQRCLKAIGTFSFQSVNRGKTHFVQYIKPMFKVVLNSCRNLCKFPNLQKSIERQI